MHKVSVELTPTHVQLYVDGKRVENAIEIESVGENDRYVDVKVRIPFDEFVAVGLDGEPFMEVT